MINTDPDACNMAQECRSEYVVHTDQCAPSTGVFFSTKKEAQHFIRHHVTEVAYITLVIFKVSSYEEVENTLPPVIVDPCWEKNLTTSNYKLREADIILHLEDRINKWISTSAIMDGNLIPHVSGSKVLNMVLKMHDAGKLYRRYEYTGYEYKLSPSLINKEKLRFNPL